MSFTQDDVNNIAHLARLVISSKSSIANDLSSIIELIKKINELDTKNIFPMAHPLEAVQRLRSDEIVECNVREEMQAIAPANGKEQGLYLVPKVVE